MKRWTTAALTWCVLAAGVAQAQETQDFASWSPRGFEHLSWTIVSNDASKESFYTYAAEKFLVQFAMKAGYLGTDGSIRRTMTITANFICFPDGSAPHYLQNVVLATYGPNFQPAVSPQKLSAPLPIDPAMGLAPIVSSICKDVAAAHGTKALQ
jgi:hypothetical protein